MIKDNNLLFLISQPRSGSSLLQQLLINTKQVKSVPEPWFMLSLVQVFRETNNENEYNPRYAYINFMEYLNRYDSSKYLLKKEIKKLALKLYNLNKLEKEIYFLDKTPRYYHIIDELKEMFPSAKFLILIRNPVSVFSSILDYNFCGITYKIHKDDRYHDLFTAPSKISSVLKKWHKKDYVIIKYEDLVDGPIGVFNQLVDYLDISFDQFDANYQVDEVFIKSRGIDRKGVLSNNNINKKYIESWKQSIDTYQKKRMLITYIEKLGPELINSLGYDYIDILQTIIKHKVKFNFFIDYKYIINKGHNISLKSFIKTRLKEKLSKLFWQ